MLYNDNDKNKKKKPGFNAQAFKHAIGMIESSGGKNMWNNNTSATGKYQFLYKLIKDDPDMKGVSRREFLRNNELQEKIMDKALNGKLKGFVYGTNYANKIKKQYNSDYGTEDITALLHFLGPGDARKFLKNPDTFQVKGVNKTPQDYISKFRGMYDEHPSQIKAMEEFNRAPAYDIYNDDSSIGNLSMPTPPKQEMPYREFMPEQRDNTQIRSRKDIPMQPAGQPAEFDMNSFRYGGQMKDSGGANDLVTMFEGGGTHEQNPLGGIPQGVGSDGAPNLVEEGETRWNDYVFSNAISLDGVISESSNKKNNYELGGDINSKVDPPTSFVNKPAKINNPASTENVMSRFYGESNNQGLSDPNNNVGIDSFSGNKNYNGFSIPENTSPGQGLLNSMDAFKTQASYPQSKVKTYPYSESADRRKKGSTFYLEDKTKNYTDPQGNVNLERMVAGEGSQAFLDRYNNEWSRARLAEQSNMTQKDIDNSIIRGMEAKKEIGGNKPGSKGEYIDDVNTIYLEKDDKNVEVHERIHASLFDESQGNYLQGILGNAFQQGEDRFPGEGKNMDTATKRYMNTPSETYANFAEFREKLGLKPGQQLTKEQYLKLVKEKGAQNENFFKTYNDDNIIKALNTVAYQGQENNDYENYRLA